MKGSSATNVRNATRQREEVRIPSGRAEIPGNLTLPEGAQGLVLFAHGSGSSRHSPRNNAVAEALQDAGMGTLLFDLLTEAEARNRDNVFDIAFLAKRLLDATRWVTEYGATKGLPIGYFGASTGAAAALAAEPQAGGKIRAIVSRGGRPDLAMKSLPKVDAPTLLIVGEYDDLVIDLNRQAYEKLRCDKDMRIVPRATHLFEEEGALEQVTEHAREWFGRYLRAE